MASLNKETLIQVPWDALLEWVQRQRDIESRTGQPVALTRAQLEALSHFVSFNDEPDVGDHDYVSLLMHKVQVQRRGMPVFEDVESASLPIDGHFVVRWRTVCRIEGCGFFPREGYGIAAQGQPPFFQSKKHAKQYAAKHAFHFLSRVVNRMMIGPPAAPAVVEPVLVLPSQLPTKTRTQAPMGHLTFSVAPSATASTSPSPWPGSALSNKYPVFQQVIQTTTQLGIDTPIYKIDPDPAGEGLFCGRPIFKNSMRVPPDLGVVRGIQGQDETKMRIAEAVLAWAQGEVQRRHGIFLNLWSSASSPRLEPMP